MTYTRMHWSTGDGRLALLLCSCDLRWWRLGQSVGSISYTLPASPRVLAEGLVRNRDELPIESFKQFFTLPVWMNTPCTDLVCKVGSAEHLEPLTVELHQLFKVVFILQGHFSYALIGEDKEHCRFREDSLDFRV